MNIKREHVERARSGYAWDVSHQWNVEPSLEAIRELTDKLGGFKEGDYVYVPEAGFGPRLRIAAASDRWSGLEGYMRCRVVDAILDEVLVIRPDSYPVTGEGIVVPAAECYWAL